MPDVVGLKIEEAKQKLVESCYNIKIETITSVKHQAEQSTEKKRVIRQFVRNEVIVLTIADDFGKEV